jgi:hypothetical protein
VNLLALHWRLARELESLATSVDAATLASSCGIPHFLGREAAVIRLLDRWNNYVRELVLLSAIGGVHRASGKSIPRRTGVRSRRDALDQLRGSYRGKQKKSPYWEPKWFDPAEAIDAAQRLALVNFADISAALGATPSPLPEIRSVRNYLAHRGQPAASRLAIYTQPTIASIQGFILSPVPSGVTRFRSWVVDLELISRAAAN